MTIDKFGVHVTSKRSQQVYYDSLLSFRGDKLDVNSFYILTNKGNVAAYTVRITATVRTVSPPLAKGVEVVLNGVAQTNLIGKILKFGDVIQFQCTTSFTKALSAPLFIEFLLRSPIVVKNA